MMKKFCFLCFILLALSVFCLFSCTKASTLYDVVICSIGNADLPCGSVSCYGRQYQNSASADFVSDYLGLSGYPDFLDKIEELAVYSSLSGEFCEFSVMKLYKSSDTADGILFFKRRASEARHALKTAEIGGYAENAEIKVFGNTVILSMLPDNSSAISAARKLIVGI